MLFGLPAKRGPKIKLSILLSKNAATASSAGSTIGSSCMLKPVFTRRDNPVKPATLAELYRMLKLGGILLLAESIPVTDPTGTPWPLGLSFRMFKG